MADLPAPTPFYRSLLFWLGLPGLLFLLWGWLAGPSSGGFVAWMNDDHYWSIGHDAGCVEIQWMDDLGIGFEYGTKGLRWDVFPDKSNLWPPPVLFEREEKPGVERDTRLRIADWVIVLAYLSGWCAVFRSWRNRKARLLKASAAPPP